MHRLDAWSPLVPPDWWVDAYRRKQEPSRLAPDTSLADAACTYYFPAPLQRASDADAGGRVVARCLYCGEGFETHAALAAHHASEHADEPAPAPRGPCRDAAAVRAFMSESRVEIVCVVEGAGRRRC